VETKIQSIPHLNHDEFLYRFKSLWRPGQHVGIVGPTGSGKTRLANDLEQLRDYVVVIATKSRDDSLEEYRRFVRRKTWPPNYNEQLILYWYPPKELGNFVHQRVAVYMVMSDIFKVGGWTIYFDDLFYISDTLRLKDAVRMYYTQVRSNNVSIVSSIQRPFWVPVEAISQSTYVLLFSTRDQRDIKRISEGLSIPVKEIERAISALQPYEFLFLQTGKEPIIIGKREI